MLAIKTATAQDDDPVELSAELLKDLAVLAPDLAVLAPDLAVLAPDLSVLAPGLSIVQSVVQIDSPRTVTRPDVSGQRCILSS